MKKLAICIPTYNRIQLLISQLNFLEKEIILHKDSIDIIVADNFSKKEHRDQLIEYHSKHNFFELKLNQTNLGSIGNIYYLMTLVNSEFIWFVSDDDILLNGVLNRIIEIINCKDPISFIFLNHNAFIENPDLIHQTVNLEQHKGYIKDGKQCLIDLFNQNGTVCMFMTACIYATAPLKRYCSTRTKPTLIDPLLFSFKLADGPIYIENNVFVLERCNGFSWTNEALAIFSWQVEAGLIELEDHFYKKEDIIGMIMNIFLSNRGNYLRMLLQSPFKYKISIINFMGLLQIKLIIPSLIFNLKRIFSRTFSLINQIAEKLS